MSTTFFMRCPIVTTAAFTGNDGAGDGLRGPNWTILPSWRTMILSAVCMIDGRWAIRMTMAPSALMRLDGADQARSPSASRLEFGSSSTMRRGFP